MGRVYTLTAEGMALTDALVGDLLLIQPVADRPFQILSCRITQREQETATQARIRLVRRSTIDTTAAAGTVTVTKHMTNDAAAAFTVTMNRTAATPTLGTESGVIAILNESLPNGFVYLPTPEERPIFVGAAEFFAVHLPSPHGVTGQTVTFDVHVVVEAFG